MSAPRGLIARVQRLTKAFPEGQMRASKSRKSAQERERDERFAAMSLDELRFVCDAAQACTPGPRSRVPDGDVWAFDTIAAISRCDWPQFRTLFDARPVHRDPAPTPEADLIDAAALVREVIEIEPNSEPTPAPSVDDVTASSQSRVVPFAVSGSGRTTITDELDKRHWAPRGLGE